MGGHRQIGRPKLKWSDVIRKYNKEILVKIEESQDRRLWRLKTPKLGKCSGRRRCMYACTVELYPAC